MSFTIPKRSDKQILGLDFAVVAYDKETGSPIELDENYIRLSAHSY